MRAGTVVTLSLAVALLGTVCAAVAGITGAVTPELAGALAIVGAVGFCVASVVGELVARAEGNVTIHLEFVVRGERMTLHGEDMTGGAALAIVQSVMDAIGDDSSAEEMLDDALACEASE